MYAKQYVNLALDCVVVRGWRTLSSIGRRWRSSGVVVVFVVDSLNNFFGQRLGQVLVINLHNLKKSNCAGDKDECTEKLAELEAAAAFEDDDWWGKGGLLEEEDEEDELFSLLFLALDFTINAGSEEDSEVSESFPVCEAGNFSPLFLLVCRLPIIILVNLWRT